ncbi:MAG: hypothetical protein PHI68_04285 [Candidatus Cloacimonetes bacterium]|nr:hypothetical protein [Candidatus Cloacimonadota bacterium]
MIRNQDSGNPMRTAHLHKLMGKSVSVTNEICSYYRFAILFIFTALILHNRLDYRLIALLLLILNLLLYILKDVWVLPKIEEFVRMYRPPSRDEDSYQPGSSNPPNRLTRKARSAFGRVGNFLGIVCVPLILFYWFSQWEDPESKAFATSVLLIASLFWLCASAFKVVVLGRYRSALALTPLLFMLWKLKVVDRQLLIPLLILGSIFYTLSALVIYLRFDLDKAYKELSREPSSQKVRSPFTRFSSELIQNVDCSLMSSCDPDLDDDFDPNQK